MAQNPHAADKAYEALAYFSTHVKYAGKVKLYKLLYYLDLMHLRRTGRTVTGLLYYAWPMGPVPKVLDDEFKEPSSRLHRAFEIKASERVTSEIPPPTIDTDESELGVETRAYSKPTKIKPRFDVHQRYLTNLEFQLTKQLCEIFHSATADQMSDVSHNHLGPWKKAMMRGKRSNVDRPVIDLLEGVVACGKANEELPRDELLDLVKEHEAIQRALS